jgi:hypothetical protein
MILKLRKPKTSNHRGTQGTEKSKIFLDWKPGSAYERHERSWRQAPARWTKKTRRYASLRLALRAGRPRSIAQTSFVPGMTEVPSQSNLMVFSVSLWLMVFSIFYSTATAKLAGAP